MLPTLLPGHYTPRYLQRYPCSIGPALVPFVVMPENGPTFPRKFPGPKKQLNVKFPETLVDQMDRVAARHGLSRSELMIHGMAWVVERLDAAAAAKKPG